MFIISKKHTNIQYWEIIIFIAFFIIISCNENKGNKKLLHENIYLQDNHLVRKILFDTGETRKVIKYYTLDTFANGAEIHYDSLGKIIKWLWFKKGIKYALYGVYFNNGKYIDKMGNPFVAALNLNNNTLAVEMANPPGVNYLFCYKDFLNNKLIRQVLKEPGKTDSTSWVTVHDHKFIDGHKYMVYYFIVDDKNKLLDSSYQELAP